MKEEANALGQCFSVEQIHTLKQRVLEVDLVWALERAVATNHDLKWQLRSFVAFFATLQIEEVQVRNGVVSCRCEFNLPQLPRAHSCLCAHPYVVGHLALREMLSVLEELSPSYAPTVVSR